jgi:hypothetical protein
MAQASQGMERPAERRSILGKAKCKGTDAESQPIVS